MLNVVPFSHRMFNSFLCPHIVCEGPWCYSFILHQILFRSIFFLSFPDGIPIFFCCTVLFCFIFSTLLSLFLLLFSLLSLPWEMVQAFPSGLWCTVGESVHGGALPGRQSLQSCLSDTTFSLHHGLLGFLLSRLQRHKFKAGFLLPHTLLSYQGQAYPEI